MTFKFLFPDGTLQFSSPSLPNDTPLAWESLYQVKVCRFKYVPQHVDAEAIYAAIEPETHHEVEQNLKPTPMGLHKQVVEV